MCPLSRLPAKRFCTSPSTAEEYLPACPEEKHGCSIFSRFSASPGTAWAHTLALPAALGSSDHFPNPLLGSIPWHSPCSFLRVFTLHLSTGQPRGAQAPCQVLPVVYVCAQVRTHLLCNILATFEVMVSIRQNLRFHNRHNPILQVRAE